MITRIFLALVGLLYSLLALYCTFMPERTSKGVGFNLQPGAGQSEFLTVYGGLELALGIVFLWPLFRPADVAFPLFVCLIVHGCLVAFRTAGFLLYSGFPSTTYNLAVGEWVIFLAAAALSWRK